MKDDQNQSIQDTIRLAFSRIGKRSPTTLPDRNLETDNVEVESSERKETEAYQEFNADSDSRVSPSTNKQPEGLTKKKIALVVLALTVLALYLYWPQNPKEDASDVNQTVQKIENSEAQHSSIAASSKEEFDELNEDWREFSSQTASSSAAIITDSNNLKITSSDQVDGISNPSPSDSQNQNTMELGFLTNMPESDIQTSSSSSSSSKMKVDKTIKSKTSSTSSPTSIRITQSSGTNDIHKKLNKVLDEINSIKKNGFNSASIVEAPNLILLSIAKARKFCDGCVAHAWINFQGVEREIGDGDTLDVAMNGIEKTYIVKIENDRLSLMDKSGVVFSYWPR